jgi:hypothetical protein
VPGPCAKACGAQVDCPKAGAQANDEEHCSSRLDATTFAEVETDRPDPGIEDSRHCGAHCRWISARSKHMTVTWWFSTPALAEMARQQLSQMKDVKAGHIVRDRTGGRGAWLTLEQADNQAVAVETLIHMLDPAAVLEG